MLGLKKKKKKKTNNNNNKKHPLGNVHGNVQERRQCAILPGCLRQPPHGNGGTMTQHQNKQCAICRCPNNNGGRLSGSGVPSGTRKAVVGGNKLPSV